MDEEDQDDEYEGDRYYNEDCTEGDTEYVHEKSRGFDVPDNAEADFSMINGDADDAAKEDIGLQLPPKILRASQSPNKF